MLKTITKRAFSTVAFSSLVALSAPAHADHAWNNYHWPRQTNPFPLPIGNNVSGPEWEASLDIAIADWRRDDAGGSPTSPLDLVEVSGATNPKQCKSRADTVQVCNDTYGYRGWLGVAQIWLTGDHITEGVVKLNDSYFQADAYNSPAWRNLVMCQELGHTFGLAHTDEDFYNDNHGTCMDYTDDPDGSLYGQLDNQHPNAHDFEQLDTIYGHTDFSVVEPPEEDGGGPPGGGPPGRNKNAEGGNDVSEWGRAISFNVDGRPDVFERNIAPGRRVVTHVFWLPERSQEH